MSEELDYSSIPERLTCQFCGGHNGHDEHVCTNDREGDNSGWDVWFCCHDCRDKGEPCETFFPIKLKRTEFHEIRLNGTTKE